MQCLLPTNLICTAIDLAFHLYSLIEPELSQKAGESPALRDYILPLRNDYVLCHTPHVNHIHSMQRASESVPKYFAQNFWICEEEVLMHNIDTHMYTNTSEIPGRTTPISCDAESVPKYSAQTS